MLLYYIMLKINLQKDNFIAKGNCRHVYLYENNRVVKVSWKETLIKRMKNKKNIFKRLIKFLPIFYDENFNDLRFYIINKHKSIYDNIPKFYGVCRTNLGFGLITEYISDNGKKIPTLYEYIKNFGVDDKLIFGIKTLWLNLWKNNVQIRAPHPHNFLVKKENKEIRIYMVDGFGSPNFIPLLDFISILGRKKIIKKFNIFIKMLKEDFPEYSNHFDNINFL